MGSRIAWLAETDIYLGGVDGSAFVLAYRPGDEVPSGVVTAYAFANTGLVKAVTINEDGTSPAYRATDPATQAELDEVKDALAAKVDTSDPRLTGGGGGVADGFIRNAHVAGDAAISADKLADGTVHKVLTDQERTKLSTVEHYATANSTDEQLRDRSTHTGTQPIASVQGLQDALDGAGAGAHTHTAAEISDATAVGRSVLKAADEAAARTAIGAGTSNLAIGTTAATAKAGNYTPPTASPTQSGIVELATTAEATTGTDTTRAVTPAGLKAVADTKAPASHLHTADQITDLDATPTTQGGLGNKLTKVGIVIPRGSAGSFDNLRTESLQVTYAPDVGRFAGVYTGYGDNVGGVEHASVGLAWSDDGFTFTKTGTALLGRTGNSADPDYEGTTGPVLVYEPESELYHLFYIGLTASGYEGGTKRLCVATSPSLTSPVWTRRGVIMSPGGSGWRAQQIWHPSFIKIGATWYCFVNASGNDAKERIGYATAPSLLGPWTFDDANSPLIDVAGADTIAGDPCVTRMPGGYRMDFFRAGATASDYYAVTSDADFPLNWRLGSGGAAILSPGPAGSYDALYAHKPIILKHAGRTFHYYTAVSNSNVRECALAIDPPKWSVATQSVTELAAARTTTSTGATWATAAQSTVMFDPVGKLKPQFRLLYRGNAGATTLRIRDMAHPAVVGTLTGNLWQNGSTPWTDVPETAIFHSFIEFQSLNGTTVSLGNVVYEFRWIDTQS